MENKVILDIRKFIESYIDEVNKSYNFCYPNHFFDSDRAHGQLQAIYHSTKMLKAFIDSIEVEKIEVKIDNIEEKKV